ncbi:MAG: type II and III secretion system protein [Candidatus Babeliales bacterium]
MMKRQKYIVVVLLLTSRFLYAEVFLPEESHQFGHTADLASVPPFYFNIKGFERGQKEFQDKKAQTGVLSQELQKHGFTAKASEASPKEVGEVKKEEEIPGINKNILDVLTNVFHNPELNAKKITIRSKPAPVIDIIEMVGRLAGIDFVIDSDVSGMTGKINCNDCTAGEVLNFVVVHNSPKLAVVKYLNMWRIMPFSKAINLVKAQLEQDYIHKVYKIYNTNFDEKFTAMVQEMWKKIVGAEDKRAYLTFDSPSRRIFAYALHPHMQELTKFIEEVDRVIPQVRIDVVIAIVDKLYFYDLGFNISGVYDRQQTLQIKNKRFGFAGLGGESVPNEQGVSEPLAFVLNLFRPRNAFIDVSNEETGPIKIPILFGGPDLNKRRLDLELNAAESQDKVRILSRPSVLTNNRETADILIGESIPISTVVEDIIEGKIRNVTTINFKDIGTELKVTPTVNLENKTVHLNIFIQDTEIKSGNTRTNDRGVLQDPPTIATIRTTNQVVLRSGQTTIIGGLVKNAESSSEQAVPFLHRVPIIGWLFKSTSDRKLDEERLIFITPTIVEHDA